MKFSSFISKQSEQAIESNLEQVAQISISRNIQEETKDCSRFFEKVTSHYNVKSLKVDWNDCKDA
jgi:hypothetical protein